MAEVEFRIGFGRRFRRSGSHYFGFLNEWQTLTSVYFSLGSSESVFDSRHDDTCAGIRMCSLPLDTTHLQS